MDVPQPLKFAGEVVQSASGLVVMMLVRYTVKNHFENWTWIQRMQKNIMLCARSSFFFTSIWRNYWDRFVWNNTLLTREKALQWAPLVYKLKSFMCEVNTWASKSCGIFSLFLDAGMFRASWASSLHDYHHLGVTIYQSINIYLTGMALVLSLLNSRGNRNVGQVNQQQKHTKNQKKHQPPKNTTG